MKRAEQRYLHQETKGESSSLPIQKLSLASSLFLTISYASELRNLSKLRLKVACSLFSGLSKDKNVEKPLTHPVKLLTAHIHSYRHTKDYAEH